MVTEPPLIAVAPPASVVRDASAVVAPTEPLKLVAPLVLTTRSWPPSTLPAIVIAPPPELASVRSAPRSIGPVSVWPAALSIVEAPATAMPAAALSATASFVEASAPPARLIVPPLRAATVKVPGALKLPSVMPPAVSVIVKSLVVPAPKFGPRAPARKSCAVTE